LMSLTAGLDRAFKGKIITVEEYRQALSELINIDPDKPYGNQYFAGEAPTNAGGEGAN